MPGVAEKKINIALIADLFLDEETFRRFALPELSSHRDGEWKITRVQSAQDIQEALSLKPVEVINTLIVLGLHNRIVDEQVNAAVRYWDPSRGKMTYMSISFWEAFAARAGRSSFSVAPLIVFDSCNSIL